jgi:hypothetical protein
MASLKDEYHLEQWTVYSSHRLRVPGKESLYGKRSSITKPGFTTGLKKIFRRLYIMPLPKILFTSG